MDMDTMSLHLLEGTEVTISVKHQGGGYIQQRYLARWVLGLSILQMVIGNLCIILHIIILFIKSPLSPVSYGIWTGIMFIATGSFGVASSCYKTKLIVVTFLILDIISAVFTLPLLVLSILDYHSVWNGHSHYHEQRPYTAMQVLAAFEAILAIVSSALACHGLGWTGKQLTSPTVAGVVRYMTGEDGRQQTVVVPVGNYTHGSYHPYTDEPGHREPNDEGG